jgi:hypothetical protein
MYTTTQKTQVHASKPKLVGKKTNAASRCYMTVCREDSLEKDCCLLCCSL